MNKLKRILILTSILFSTCHFCMAGGNRDYVEYVNPLMGSQSVHSFSTGNTYPAIATPWGMNFWTPLLGMPGEDGNIKAFMCSYSCNDVPQTATATNTDIDTHACSFFKFSAR